MITLKIFKGFIFWKFTSDNEWVYRMVKINYKGGHKQ